MSAMRDTMAGQPAALRALLADAGSAEAPVRALAGRRLWLVGTGTSWHAANHGAWFLRAGGVEAWPVAAADCAVYGPEPAPEDGLILLSHTGAKRYANTVLERARAAGARCVRIGARGTGADVETVERERSSAHTASHLGALLRLAQIASGLGAHLGDLEAVPDAVAAALDSPGPGVAPPARLLELTGAGPNQWTAAEGALKVRETARVAAQGLAVEQLLHGPAVALGGDDALVCLDGGGPLTDRVEEVAGVAEAAGARVYRVTAPELGERLSVFPLTAAVQRIALECAEALGTDPDAFGHDVPGRKAAWEAVDL